MRKSVELVQAAYDGIAEAYDAQWSVHLREPQARLTEDLRIEPGLRCADLGCGTGVDTLDMVRLAAPGEVIGVDCSSGMLEAARSRAQSAGFTLTTVCQEAEDYIQTCPPASLDIITLRFVLAYVDWRAALPKLPALLRAGGRVGILTNLSSSAPQAYSTYREMVRDLNLPDVPLTVPSEMEQMTALLEQGGGTIEESWTHSFRLWFATGADMASWLQESGFATHPALSALPRQFAELLWKGFAERVEACREPQGLPLDFDLAGVIARV
ncbi:MAG: class I SAM-dependent methyltransferase [Polyangiales bacterium]